MKKLILFLTLTFSLCVYSQKIKGTVFDSETKKPIIEAHIEIENKIIITDKKGRFSFSTPKNWNKRVTITHISYKTKELLYNKGSLLIYLKPRSEQLKEILLTGNRGNKKLNYETLAEMPKKLHSFGTTMIDNKIYVFGGDNSLKKNAYRIANERLLDPNVTVYQYVEEMARHPSFNRYSDQLYVYDISNNRWINEKVTLRKRANHTATFLNNKVYLIGGKRLTRSKSKELLDEKIEVYDPITKTLEIDDTNPHKAADLETIVFNDHIYVFGGSVKKNTRGKKDYLGKIHQFNPKTGYWYLLSEIPIKEDISTSLVDDKLYFLDGLDSNKNTNSIVSLNLKNGKIVQEGKLFYNFENPAVTSENHMIYLFENGKFITFDTRKREQKDYRIDLMLFGSKIYVANNKVYILGGFTKDDLAIEPQKKLYKIDLTELPKTKVRKYSIQ